MTRLRAVIILLLTLGIASAQQRDFSLRYSVNAYGGIQFAGNALVTCQTSSSCTAAQNGGTAANNSFNSRYIDEDDAAGLSGAAATESSSRARLSLPAGASILWAGLYWGADDGGYSGSLSRDQIKLHTPGTSSYTTVQSVNTNSSGNDYQSFSEVTSLVRTGGAGDYWAADIRAQTNSGDDYGVWALVVVYEDPNQTIPRNLTVFDGYRVASNNTIDVSVSGFTTPLIGPINSELGMVAYEGDTLYTGDQMLISTSSNPTFSNLGNASYPNQTSNFFDSSFITLDANRNAVRYSDKLPDYINNLGVDVDILDVSNNMSNGDTSAAFRFTSTGDVYFPGVITFTTDLYEPDLEAVKGVTDVNGGSLQAGDQLEYSITVTNTDFGTAEEVVLTDPIPNFTSYVPGSIQIDGVAQGDSATDGDTASYDATSNAIILNLGDGASSSQGGTFDFNDTVTVSFRVTIDSGTPSDTPINNRAELNYFTEFNSTDVLIATGTSTVTVEVGSSVTYELSGTVFEDVNYGGGAGRSQLVSSGVGVTGARVELYDGSGNFVDSTTTGLAGDYYFQVASGDYRVRVVNDTVRSTRPGGAACTSCLAVQTYRYDPAAGAVTDEVGGVRPDQVDPGASTTSLNANAQSVTAVSVSNFDISGLEFGFNFNTIVNTRNAGQGSLRQFILNSNALGNAGLAQVGQPAGVDTSIFMISDGNAHPGLRAGLVDRVANNGTVTFRPSSSLPAITDTFTALDGTTQTANVGDTNSNLQGTGGVVGVDGLTLDQLNGPEVNLRGRSTVTVGIDIQANNTTLRGFGVFEHGTITNDDSHANVRIGNDITGTLIEQNILGTPAQSFRGSGGATATNACRNARSNADNIRSLGADNGIVRNNLIGFAEGHGFAATNGTQSWLVETNEFRCNAINHPTYNGINLEGTNTTATTVQGNLIWQNEGAGIDSYLSSGGHNIFNNTVSENGIGSGVTQVTSGVRLFGADNTVSRNIIFNNYGAGILVADDVAPSSGNTLSQNSIYGNGTLLNKAGEAASGHIGIDLLDGSEAVNTGTAPFVTPNDDSDSDTGANGLLNFPVFDLAELDNTTLTLTGFAPAGAVLELFIADSSANPDPNPYSFDFGEGQTYLLGLTEGSAADTDSGTGTYNNDAGTETGAERFSFAIPLPTGVALGSRLTATATDSSGNTSEFSNVIAVTGAAKTVSGNVYFDANSDDSFGGADSGLANISVNIYLDDGDALFDPASDTLIASPVSGAGGTYSSTLAPGDYWAAVDVTDADLPANYVPGGPTALLVTLAGTDVTGNDFPFERLANAFVPCSPLVYLFQNDPSDVFGINLATGSSQLLANDIGPGGRGIHTNGLGYNVQDDFIYGSNSTDADGTITRVDSNFDVTLLGPIAGLPKRSYYVGDVSPTGQLYFYNNSTAELYAIELDPNSSNYLEMTTIPMSQNISITDIAFNPIDNQIYTVHNSTKDLYRINPLSGAVTNLGNTGVTGSTTFGAQYYDARGFFYMSKNQDGLIYRVDTSNPASIDPTAIVFSNGPLSGQNDGAHCLYAELPIDYGDAPFQTLLVDDGARHAIDPLGPRLGTSPDEESDGQPGVSADGDDNDGSADEDGILSGGASLQNTAVRAGDTITLEVNTTGTGVLNAWIDWERDGSFDPADRIAADLVPPASGIITLSVTVPGTVEPGTTYARFRFASESLEPTGPAADGEVEDYRIFLANIIISGTVFYDDGFGSGTAHDGIQNGNEQGISGVTVTATDGTLTRTTVTDTNGFYIFYTTPFGTNVTVSHTAPRATGSSILGSTVAACLATSLNDSSAAAQLITDTNCSDSIDGSEAGFLDGQIYPGYDFGVVHESRFTSDQSGQVSSPGTIGYSHLFDPGTLGTAIFDIAGSYSYDLFIDENCNGTFDPGEGPHAQPHSLVVGTAWPRLASGDLQECAVRVRVIVPDGEANGTTDVATVSADLNWLDTAISESLSLTDTTVIAEGGQLSLSKDVCNITTGCSAYAVTGTGKPGEVLEYRITFSNLGTDIITNVRISDPIPFFTTLALDQYGSGEAQLTCPDSSVVQLDTGIVTTLAVDVMTSCGISELQPGKSGTVLFRARID